MSPRTRIDRRTVLRGLLAGAAVTVGLPLFEATLDSNGTALAAGTPLPKRFGLFFWGNGILADRWVPTAEGADWEPSLCLEPLAEHRKNITVVSGMKVYTGNKVPHGSGPVGMLSGAPFPSTDTNTFAVPSIDQVIAAAAGGETRFRSLEVGVQRSTESLSYNGIHSINPQEASPQAFFDRLFGEGFVAPGTTPKADPRLALRRSVLDAVGEDAKRLQARLGKNDQVRLDQHLSGIRALELQLKKFEENPPNLASCALPAMPLPDYPDMAGRPQLSEVSRVMADIVAMALACDQTRIFSFWFSTPVNNLLFPGATAGHHQLTHDEPDDQPQVFAIVKYIMTELAYLISALKKVPEGDGTLLDNCGLLATTDCSYAKSHSVEDYPILIAGTAGGALKQGLHYRSPSSENTSKVLLTLARAFGLPLSEYGEKDGLVTESLTAIEA
jgi:hypothetical protein